MWCVRLKDGEIEALRVLVRSQGGEDPGDVLSGSMEALELACWDDLPEAVLPWDELERTASQQGISIADAFWDRAGRVPEPPASKERPKSRNRPCKKLRK